MIHGVLHRISDLFQKDLAHDAEGVASNVALNRFEEARFIDQPHMLRLAKPSANLRMQRLGKCPIDLDGDLLVEPPARDRVADVPMVDMVGQSVTVGVTPEDSGSVSISRSTDYEVKLELRESFTMQLSGLLSVEGGFSSKLSGGGKEQSRALGFNEKHSLQYDAKTEAIRQRVAKRLASVETKRDIRFGAEAGYVSIQFTVRNSGSQAVILRDPAFAVLSRVRDRSGKLRTVTVVPERPIRAPHSTPDNPRGMEVTLGPGETRTISLRVGGQSTAMIRELLQGSSATWATLHFAKQIALTEPKVQADGTVVPSQQRDVSRDLVASVRRRTIPFLFVPPKAYGALPRTTLFAAVPAGVRNKSGVECEQSADGRSHIGATITELFRYHGTPLETSARRSTDGTSWIVPRLGNANSTPAGQLQPESLLEQSVQQRRLMGRWELRVYHRDFGVVALKDLETQRLTPQHRVVMRWVSGEDILQRALAGRSLQEQPVRAGQTSFVGVPVRPGDEVRIHFSAARTNRPLWGERLASDECTVQSHVRRYQSIKRGQVFTPAQLAREFPNQLRVRYAYVSAEDAALLRAGRGGHKIQWRYAALDDQGKLRVKVPSQALLPKNVQLVVIPDPLTVVRRAGEFSVDANNHETPKSFGRGRIVREQYQLQLEGVAQVIPDVRRIV